MKDKDWIHSNRRIDGRIPFGINVRNNIGTVKVSGQKWNENIKIGEKLKKKVNLILGGHELIWGIFPFY